MPNRLMPESMLSNVFYAYDINGGELDTDAIFNCDDDAANCP